LLQERAAAGKLAPDTTPALRKLLAQQTDVSRRLRALWTLHAIGDADETLLDGLLGDSHEYLRGWAIQLELDDRQASAKMLSRFATLAKQDPSPVVRRHLASALQRLPAEQRWPIAEALVAHAEDASDQNLSLLYWYGVEPLVSADAKRFIGLIAKAAVPIVREHVARRAVEAGGHLEAVVRALREAPVAARRDVLHGVHAGLAGRRTVPMPAGWPELYTKLASTAIRMCASRPCCSA